MVIGSDFKPTFGSNLADVIRFQGNHPFTRPIRITTTSSPPDIFVKAEPGHARIILDLDAEKLHFGPGNLKGLNAHQFTQVYEGLQSRIRALASGKAVDDWGNMLAATNAPKADADNPSPHLALVNKFEGLLTDLPKDTKELTVVLPEKIPAGIDQEALYRELAEKAALQGLNTYFHRGDNTHPNALEQVVFSPGSSFGNLKQALEEGRAIGEAMNVTRHLVDAGANYKTTQRVYEVAKSLESDTLKVSQLKKKDLEKEGMGLFLSVGQGNDYSDTQVPRALKAVQDFALKAFAAFRQFAETIGIGGLIDNIVSFLKKSGLELPVKADTDLDGVKQPRLVEMVYTSPDFDPEKHKTVLMVGKGIIFDTGGNNLKPSEFIHNMHGDMAGAAAVVGTMKTIDAMKLKGIRVIGMGACSENRLSAAATLPYDQYIARNGKSVQIANTDAEGRLVLADAIHYGMEKYKPDVVADIATLTGGKVRGVGKQNAIGISGNNLPLMQHVDRLSKEMGRKTAVLELKEDHRKWVTKNGKGKADVYNAVPLTDAYNEKAGIKVLSEPFDPKAPSKEGMQAHCAQGAAFLREFLYDPQTPWVHYDIAGAEFAEKDQNTEEFATGFGVKDLYMLARSVAEGKVSPNAADSQI